MFSLLHPIRQLPIAVVDVETTGASAALGHHVIEIGIVRVEGGQPVARYQQLIDPIRSINPGVSVLTGITQDMVNGQPRFAQCLDAILPLLQGAAIMGHNIRFDLSFLHKEFRRAGVDLSETLGAAPVLDTVRIARKRFGRGGNSLGTLARRLGIQPTAAHRALADAETTAAVFDVFMQASPGWDGCLCDVLQEQGGTIDLKRCAGPDLLPLELEEALEMRKPVMMEYLDARSARTQRIIEPLHVRKFRGELLLVAHCRMREERRTFKLERIVQLRRVEPQNDPTVPPTA